MDAVNNSISHTYNGTEITSPLFFEPTENVPSVWAAYRFLNVVDKANIYLPRKLRKIVQAYVSCGRPAGTKQFDLNDKTISVDRVRADVDQCFDTFLNTAFSELIRKGTDIDKLSGTIVGDMVLRQFLEGWSSDLFRLFWFGEKGGASADYNSTDGIFKYLDDAVTATTIGYSLDMNTNAAIEVAGALQPGGAIIALKDLYEKTPKPIRQIPMSSRKFLVTCTIFDDLTNTYEQLGTDSGLQLVQDGNSMLKFRGIEVVAVPEWDANLADGDNTFNASIGANAIVYTTPRENLIFASDVNATTVRVRDSEDDDEILKISGKIKIGAQVIEEGLVGYAF